MIDLTRKKFGLISLGCDKNRLDAEKLLARIRARGCKITNDIGEAQVLVVNTCSFLADARKEAIETIIESAAYKRGKLEKIVVTGCLPQKFIGEIYDELTEADVFLGTYDYDMFFDALQEAYAKGRSNRVCGGNDAFSRERVLTTPLHYAYLKIADGCNNKCTYCLIPKIRGAYFSYPQEELVKEASALGEIAELILVAQDVTRYGTDIYGEKRLCSLIGALTALDNIGSVRLLYCYPEMIDDDLIAVIRDDPKVIKYLDVPLQHSEDGVLKRMNRKGTRQSYLGLIKKLREEIPGVAVRSTFICGFPGETEEESAALGSFLREAKLDNCGFFAYSLEEVTLAYNLKGQVPAAVKKRRVRAMYAVQREISLERLNGYIGKKLRVLCDGVCEDGSGFFGRAYFSAPDIDGKVFFNAPFAEQGKYYDVCIEDADSYNLYGRTEDYGQ